MKTLAPDVLLSATPEEKSTFISTLPQYEIVEDPNSIPDSEPSDSSSAEPSIFTTTFPSDLSSEETPSVPDPGSSDSPRSEPSSLIENSPSYFP